MATIDKLYYQLANDILLGGFWYTDPTRANIAMLQLPHWQLDYDMSQGFPLLTTKKVAWKAALTEFLWILKGYSDITYLHKHNVHIWDRDVANFDPKGINAGRVYGSQLRHWNNRVDQMQDLFKGLKHRPFNRRHLVSLWNPSELHLMALPPCFWAFEVLPDIDFQGKTVFALKWHQRSVDTFLGLPFDIAWFGFMGKLIERETGYRFTRLIGDLSNVHFYGPHLPSIEQQLARSVDTKAPGIRINQDRIWTNLEPLDFEITGYNPAPAIKAELFTQTTK